MNKRSFLIIWMLILGCYTGFAQNVETEDSLNKLIDELHELGAKPIVPDAAQ